MTDINFSTAGNGKPTLKMFWHKFVVLDTFSKSLIVCLLLLVLAVPFVASQKLHDSRQFASTPSSLQTVTFNDLPQNQVLTQYPTGIINWGSNMWIVYPPSGGFSTNSLQYANNVSSASFAFMLPRRVVSIDAYNYGGSGNGTVTISCAGQPTVSASVAPNQILTIRTNWTADCSPVTLASSISWDMLFDNLVIDDATGGSTPSPSQVPTVSPSPSPSQVPTVSPTVSPSPTSTPTPTPPTSGMWLPTTSTPIHWQWQLANPLNTSTNLIPNVTVYDIDGFDNSASTVTTLHSKGYRAVCYIDAGTWENWRTDANQFPTALLGSSVGGWAGEKWLDIRGVNNPSNTNAQKLKQIMSSRFAMCKQKGFDAIEADNVDGYANTTGFPLTYQDQLNYNEMYASLAHSYGLSIAQKNDGAQSQDLQPYFDWALDESCYQYNECSGFTPYTNAKKAVFEVEYSTTSQCSTTNPMHFNSMTRDLNLTAPGSSGYKRTPCIPDTQNNW